MKKKDIRLYNLIFPFHFFLLQSVQLWYLLLPVNFLIDSLVLYLSARHQRLDNRLTLWRQNILSIWLIGFFSDFVGAFVIFLLNLLSLPLLLPEWEKLVMFLISIPAVIVAGILIYALNLNFSFRKSGLDEKAIHRLCLHLAIFTAPYTMLIPL